MGLKAEHAGRDDLLRWSLSVSVSSVPPCLFPHRWPTRLAAWAVCEIRRDQDLERAALEGFPCPPALSLRRPVGAIHESPEPAFAYAIVMGTLGGFPNPPAMATLADP